MQFKNYKDLCIQMGLEIKKSTNSKKAQFKELSRYCKYSKSGQKIIIEEVFETVHDKVDMRYKSIYRDVVQLLIADLLAQRKGRITISKSKLMTAIGMVNLNYNECKQNIPKLVTYTEINKNVIFDFYNTSASSFSWIIESSLDDLMDRRVIMYKKVIKVAELIDKGEELYNFSNRIADNYETETIMRIEKETLEELGYIQISQVRMSKNWNKFKVITKKKAKYELGIEYYYTAYDIIVNDDYIEKERNKLASLLLEKVKREQSKEELNNLIYDNVIKNAEKRHSKGFTNGKKAKMRTSTDYIDYIKQLSDLLIDIKHPYIAQQVKDIKLFETIVLTKEVENEMERLFG